MQIKRLILRSWFYFRIGHATYLAFLLNFAQWMIVLYTLYIVNSPFIILFPHLSMFLLAFGTVYPTIAILSGYMHLKRTAIFKREIEVSTEANPYTYSVVPESKEEIMMDIWILQAKLIHRLSNKENLFESLDEKKQYLEDIEKMKHLLEGGDIRHFDKKMA